jgi:hypothetical protein
VVDHLLDRVDAVLWREKKWSIYLPLIVSVRHDRSNSRPKAILPVR